MADQHSSTCERLLESAGQVFAAKGYRDATVAEICEGAGANVAAVNYHFGDKRSLYDAVWHLGIEASRETYPLPGPGDGPPERLLAAAVHALLNRVFDPGRAGWMATLQLREMAEPTEALPDMVRESIVPTRKMLMEIVGGVLGTDASPRQIELCTMSLASQIIFLSFSQPVRQQLVKQKEYTEASVEAYADHIVSYNLAALKQLSASLSSRTP